MRAHLQLAIGAARQDFEFLLGFVQALVELAHQHQHGLEHIERLAERPIVDAGQSSPTASYLWWKAELLRQFDAQARVEEPVEIGERIGAGLGLVSAGILLPWLWRQIDSWASAGEGVWAALPWLTTLALVVCTSGYVVWGLLMWVGRLVIRRRDDDDDEDGEPEPGARTLPSRN